MEKLASAEEKTRRNGVWNRYAHSVRRHPGLHTSSSKEWNHFTVNNMAAIQTKRRDTERIQNRDFILTKYDKNSDYDEHFPQFSTEWYKTLY